MHEKVNKLLLVRDIFMHEVHSRQPGFTCSTCKLFNKNKERIEKFTEMVDSQYFYQNELDKACFQDDTLIANLNIYLWRTASDKVFTDTAFNIAKIQNEHEFPSMNLLSTWICFNGL